MGSIAWFPLLAMFAGAAQAAATPPTLSPTDQAAAFKAAGFSQRGGQWRSPCDDPGTPGYTPGSIEQVADLNGDGRPEAIVTEGSSFCYGMTGQSYTLVSQQADGRWKRMATGIGIPIFLETRGAKGWPDLQIGGPGFCFPVERWNGREYRHNRFEYEGKRCKGPR